MSGHSVEGERTGKYNSTGGDAEGLWNCTQVGVLTAVPISTIPWHWVNPTSSYATAAFSTYSYRVHIWSQCYRTAGQLSHESCLPWVWCMTNVIPEKWQLSRQNSHSHTDLHQFRIWPGCFLHRKCSKRRGEYNWTQTLAWTQKITGLEKSNTLAANASQGKCCSSDWPFS